MKQLFTLIQQFLLLLVIVHCTLGATTQSPPQPASLPNVEAKNFLAFKAGSWPSVDPNDTGQFLLRHLSRSHEHFFRLRDPLLAKVHPDSPFRISFRYWASHDLARIRVYLANGGHQDYLLNHENQWTEAEISIQPAKSGRWTYLELLGADDSYTFAMKNATVHYTDKAKEEQHTLVCHKGDYSCRDIFEDGFSLVSQQYVTSTSLPTSQQTVKYIPVSDSIANENSFALNLTVPSYPLHQIFEYCLYFNFSTQKGNSLKVTADGLATDDRHYALTYRSYDGPIAKVCTSWVNSPNFKVKQLLITFDHSPYGLLDQFWVQLVRAEFVKPKISPAHLLYGTGEFKELYENLSWADLFVNVPSTVDLSKNGQIGFKLDQLQALKLDNNKHIVDLSTIWFNSLEIKATKDQLVALRLTPSGDYKKDCLTTEVLVSSPTRQVFISSYIREMFPKENVPQLGYLNCSDRFPLCREAKYYKLTFRFYIDLECAVDQSVQQININYGNVSINDPCIDPATGADEKCNGHGLCVAYPWEFSSSCLCHPGFTGKQCEHALPTTIVY